MARSMIATNQSTPGNKQPFRELLVAIQHARDPINLGENHKGTGSPSHQAHTTARIVKRLAQSHSCRGPGRVRDLVVSRASNRLQQADHTRTASTGRAAAYISHALHALFSSPGSSRSIPHRQYHKLALC
ncbi:hypothetical protein HU200_000167 [Digitaria exilis]|uniref:Uncharacterized protein n=1 Tax=Digitaria exilis TaxID=1010633 RepID=A0A835KVQ3_9POAL|nr:hypothetical protein HU200_000167 [Digitaria exilis]